MHRLLLIEDNKDLTAMLLERLRRLYSIEHAPNASRGLHVAKSFHFDLLILDVGLPDLSGMELCGRIRRERINTPILMLTGRVSTEDKVTALDAGADDYLTKPFQFGELEARIRALIRRGPAQLPDPTLEYAGLGMNTEARALTWNGIQIPLKRKEFDILEFMFRNQSRVITRGMLLEHVWSGEVNEMTNSVDVHVGRLRHKLLVATGIKFIQTVYGFGYRLQSPSPSHVALVELTEGVT